MYQVIPYGGDNGPYFAFRETVRTSGDGKILAKVDSKINSLAEHGLALLETQMLDNIGGDIYELRPRPYRVFCYYDRQRETFVLLNGFRKKTGKTPENEKRTARVLTEEYKTQRGIK